VDGERIMKVEQLGGADWKNLAGLPSRPSSKRSTPAQSASPQKRRAQNYSSSSESTQYPFSEGLTRVPSASSSRTSLDDETVDDRTKSFPLGGNFIAKHDPSLPEQLAGNTITGYKAYFPDSLVRAPSYSSSAAPHFTNELVHKERVWTSGWDDGDSWSPAEER
jgi:hypothetical protein